MVCGSLQAAPRLFEGLVDEGYFGVYDSVRRFVQKWKLDNQSSPLSSQAFIPLAFQPGEVCQFDWSQDDCMDAGGRATQEQLPEPLTSAGLCKRSRWPIFVWLSAVKCSSLLILGKPRRW